MATSCDNRINWRECLLPKELTKRQTKNFIDSVKLHDYAEILKIGEFLQPKPARNSAGMLSTPCGDFDRPTSVEGGQLLRRICPRSRSGPINEIIVFNKEGSEGINVKVQSTSNPEILIWFNACTEEVQNCRQIAAISWVVLTENQSNETSKGSGKPCSTECHIDSQGKPWAWATADSRNKIGLLFHAQVIFQKRHGQVYPKRQPGWRSTLENVTEQEHLSLERTHRVSSKILPRHDQRTDTVSDSWKAYQSNKERKIWSMLERRSRDDRSAVTTARVIPIFNENNLCPSELYKVTQARTWIFRRFLPIKIEKGVCIIAVSCWILKTWRSNKISTTCARMIGNKQRQNKQCISQSFRHWIRTPTRSTSITSTWRTIMTDCLWWIWKQRRIRWDSIRQRTWVSGAPTQFRPCSSQRSWTSKTDQERFGKEKSLRGSTVSQEKESIRPRTAEGNLLA